MQRRAWAVLLILFVVVGSTSALLTVPVACSELWIDEITGSTKTKYGGLLGEGSIHLEPSPLRQWSEGRNRAIEYRWTFLSSREENFLGTTLGRGCGLAPAIYYLRAEWQPNFIEKSSDTKIEAFIDVMTHGDRPAQDVAVGEACTRAIGASVALSP